MRAQLRRVAARFAALFRHDTDDRDLVEEVEAHVAMREDDLIRRGMSRDDARRQARLDVGPLHVLRDAHRDRRVLPWFDALRLDLAGAMRSFRRDAAASAAAFAIIAIGMGAAVTVFSIIDTIVVRPLPFADAGRLVWLANGTSTNLSEQTLQVSHLVALQARAQRLDRFGGFSPFYGVGDARLTVNGVSQRVTAVPITEEFLPLLGVAPVAGRLFTHDECLPGAPRATLISYALWRRRFGGAPIVGQTITLDDTFARVVGVLPKTFDFAAAFAPGGAADVFVPFP